MSTTGQVRLHITPLPHMIAWEMRDDQRRLGTGHEDAGNWEAIRGVELRSGVACVEVKAEHLGEAGRAAALRYGWTVKFAA